MNIYKRFAKDHAVPIPVFESPYWEHFVDLYGPFFDVRHKLGLLEDSINAYGSESNFFEHVRSVEEAIVNDVSSKPEYAKLAADKLEAFEVRDNPFRNQQLYCQENVGKTILSVDLVTANFYALRHYSPNLVDGAEDFRKFLNKYKPGDYIRASKRLRQYVFGNLMPKKQQKISRWQIHQLMLTTQQLVDIDRIRYFSSDEFYIIGTPEQIAQDKIALEYLNPNRVRLSVVTIEPIHKGFVKLQDGKPPRFVGIPSYELAETIRHYLGEPPQVEDRFFVHEGRIAQYQSPLFEVADDCDGDNWD